MGRKLTTTEKTIYDRADEILFYLWDPIGISDVPQTRDEYHHYLGPVFSKLMQNSTPTEIADYLVMVETQNMGLSPNKEHALKIAKILLEMKEWMYEQTS